MYGSVRNGLASGGVGVSQQYQDQNQEQEVTQPTVSSAETKRDSDPLVQFFYANFLQSEYKKQQELRTLLQSTSSFSSTESTLISFPIDDSQLPPRDSLVRVNDDTASSPERKKTRKTVVRFEGDVEFDLSTVFTVWNPEEWAKVEQQPFWKCLVGHWENTWPQYPDAETAAFKEALAIAWEERPIKEAIAYYQALAALPEGSVDGGWFSDDCDYKTGYTIEDLLLTKDAQKAKDFVQAMWRFECERPLPKSKKIKVIEKFAFRMWSIGLHTAAGRSKHQYQAQAKQVQLAFFSQVPRNFLAQYACTIWNKKEVEKSNDRIDTLASTLYMIGNDLLDGGDVPEEQRKHVQHIHRLALAYKTMGRDARDTDSPPGLVQMRLVEWIGPDVDSVRERMAVKLAHAWHAKHPLELDFSRTALSAPLTEPPPNLQVLAGLGLQKLDLSGHSLNIADRLHELLHLGAQCTIDLRDNDPVITQKMLAMAIAIAKKVKKKDRPTVLIGSSSNEGVAETEGARKPGQTTSSEQTKKNKNFRGVWEKLIEKAPMLKKKSKSETDAVAEQSEQNVRQPYPWENEEESMQSRANLLCNNLLGETKGKPWEEVRPIFETGISLLKTYEDPGSDEEFLFINAIPSELLRYFDTWQHDEAMPVFTEALDMMSNRAKVFQRRNETLEAQYLELIRNQGLPSDNKHVTKKRQQLQPNQNKAVVVYGYAKSILVKYGNQWQDDPRTLPLFNSTLEMAYQPCYLLNRDGHKNNTKRWHRAATHAQEVFDVLETALSSKHKAISDMAFTQLFPFKYILCDSLEKQGKKEEATAVHDRYINLMDDYKLKHGNDIPGMEDVD